MQWVAQIRDALPELPAVKLRRFQEQYGLSAYDAEVLVAERSVADYYEAVLSASGVPAKLAANWTSGELFGLLNQAGESIETLRFSPQDMAGLLQMVAQGEINQNTGKAVLAEMFQSGQSAEAIVAAKGLRQISDTGFIAGLVAQVLADNPEQVTSYLGGKEGVARWLFGQVMRAAKGQANPQVLQGELDRQLARRKDTASTGS